MVCPLIWFPIIQALIRPVLKLLKKYELVVLGDREFHSVELARWLLSKKVNFVFRQKKGTFIQLKKQPLQPLSSLGLRPETAILSEGDKGYKYYTASFLDTLSPRQVDLFEL